MTVPSWLTCVCWAFSAQMLLFTLGNPATWRLAFWPDLASELLAEQEPYKQFLWVPDDVISKVGPAFAFTATSVLDVTVWNRTLHYCAHAGLRTSRMNHFHSAS
jgi:hypothetical protein